MNELTTDNAYQQRGGGFNLEAEVQSAAAKREHRELRRCLADAGVAVVGLHSPDGKPDAIFPNNSFSIHEKDGRIIAILYPMSPGRRDELPTRFIDFLKEIAGEHFHDLRAWQDKGEYLEGTGVLNFDAAEEAILMSRSQRASEKILPAVADILGIDRKRIFVFDSFDRHGRPVYHTNVMSWIGQGIIGICLDSIPPGPEKSALQDYLRQQEYRIVDLTMDEMDSFAGNALEVMTQFQRRLLTMSTQAWNALGSANRALIQDHYGAEGVIACNIKTIENLGGGSVRCTQAKAELPLSDIEHIKKRSKYKD